MFQSPSEHFSRSLMSVVFLNFEGEIEGKNYLDICNFTDDDV